MLLEQNASTSAAAPDGTTALMLAVASGRTDMVRLLLQAHADVNPANSAGETALTLAAHHDNLVMVVELLRAGASLHATDHQGRCALMHAVTHGSLFVVMYLLGAGAYVTAVDGAGNTALMHAAVNGQWAAMDLLRAHGADAQHANQAGRTPAAAAQDALRGTDIETPDAQGRTPLMAAASEGLLSKVEALIGAGAQLDAVDADGNTALMHAARAGQWAAMDTLHLLGADAQARNHAGISAYEAALETWRAQELEPNADDTAGAALEYAAQRGYASLLQALLGREGAEQAINSVNASGDTPLILAASGGHLGAVQVLLSFGADVYSTNANGFHAVKLAYDLGYDDVAWVLIESRMRYEQVAPADGGAEDLQDADVHGANGGFAADDWAHAAGNATFAAQMPEDDALPHLYAPSSDLLENAGWFLLVGMTLAAGFYSH